MQQAMTLVHRLVIFRPRFELTQDQIMRDIDVAQDDFPLLDEFLFLLLGPSCCVEVPRVEMSHADFRQIPFDARPHGLQGARRNLQVVRLTELLGVGQISPCKACEKITAVFSCAWPGRLPFRFRSRSSSPSNAASNRGAVFLMRNCLGHASCLGRFV